METPVLGCALLATILILQFSTQLTPTSATRPLPIRPRRCNTNTEYIKSSCNTTTYPKLCYRSLSIYATRIKTSPKILAHTALNVTLNATKSTSRLMKRLSRTRGLKPRESAAIADCVEVVGDSVYELQRSIGEMGHVTASNFYMVMSDIQTWVSAALTDESTCMDGFAEKGTDGNVKILVRKHVPRIARLTSNALALVNRYASTQANLP